jgi:hypothetical protein
LIRLSCKDSSNMAPTMQAIPGAAPDHRRMLPPFRFAPATACFGRSPS